MQLNMLANSPVCKSQPTACIVSLLQGGGGPVRRIFHQNGRLPDFAAHNAKGCDVAAAEAARPFCRWRPVRGAQRRSPRNSTPLSTRPQIRSPVAASPQGLCHEIRGLLPPPQRRQSAAPQAQFARRETLLRASPQCPHSLGPGCVKFRGMPRGWDVRYEAKGGLTRRRRTPDVRR